MFRLQKEFAEKANLIRQIVNKEPTIREAILIERVGMDCSVSTMRFWLKRNGIKLIRTRVRKYKTKKQDLLNANAKRIITFLNEGGPIFSVAEAIRQLKLDISNRILSEWIQMNVKVKYELKDSNSLKKCRYCGSDLTDCVSDLYCMNCGLTLVNKE